MMPKKAEYQIVWSQTKNAYMFLHGAFAFDLTTTGSLHYWLENIVTVHFCSATGHTLTLRRERKQRGDDYWYAYKHVNGKVQRKYLGALASIDLALLENIARAFVEPAPSSPPHGEQETPPPPPPRTPTLTFKGTLGSALQLYGFPAVPDRKALMSRYRELSKRYHPDTGGLHEDQVAVNLAYDYLKKFL
jgi:hypothetical protein